MVVGVVPIVLAAEISGTLLGLLAGYYERWGDLLIMRVVDVWVAFPTILLAMAVVTVLGPGMVNIMIAVGIAWIPYYAHYGAQLGARDACAAVYRGGARARDRRLAHDARAHSAECGRADYRYVVYGYRRHDLTGASLSFLGLGPQSPTPEWGVIPIRRPAVHPRRRVDRPVPRPGDRDHGAGG